MGMLKDHYESALLTDEHDHHLAFDIHRILRSTTEGNEVEDRDLEEAEAVEEFPLKELFKACEDWYLCEEYERGQDALDLFDDCIDHCVDLEWYDVAAELLIQNARLKASFSGQEPDTELKNCYQFLRDYLDHVSFNWVIEIIEFVEEHSHVLDEDEINDWENLCEDLADQQRDNQSFRNERLFINHQISLNQELDEDVSGVQNRIIESFENEASVKGESSENLRATILETGLKTCVEFLPSEKKQEWKREALEARRDGISEMAEIRIDEELEEAAAEEGRQNVERIVEWTKQTIEYYRDSTYALYCLLWSDGYVPSYERARLIEAGFVFSQIMDTQVISPEGHAIGSNPRITSADETRRLPRSYVQNVFQNHVILSSALYRLIEQRVFTEFDFYKLLAISRASADTVAFLTDAIIELFNGRYINSFALSIPYLEGTVVDTLDSQGRAISALTEEGTQQRALGGLLDTLEGELDEEYRMYLKTTYADPRGLNYRNRWGHGQIGYRDLSFRTGAMVIFDTLKTALQLDPCPFVAVYSLPSRTISTQERRQSAVNISEFLEADERVLGYGFDELVGVIVVEDPTEGTILRVVRASVFDDYPLYDQVTDREELQDQVDLLTSSVPVLPLDLDIEWLDTEESIQEKILSIILSLNQKPMGEATIESIKQVGETFGLRGPTVERTVDDLQASGEVTQNDNLYSINT